MSLHFNCWYVQSDESLLESDQSGLKNSDVELNQNVDKDRH